MLHKFFLYLFRFEPEGFFLRWLVLLFILTDSIGCRPVRRTNRQNSRSTEGMVLRTSTVYVERSSTLLRSARQHLSHYVAHSNIAHRMVAVETEL